MEKKIPDLILAICYILVAALVVVLFASGIVFCIEKTAEHYANTIEANAPKPEQQIEQSQEPDLDPVPQPVYIYVPREEQYYIDLELLAHLIYSEVGDDGEEAMYYAGSVVLNRIRNGEYPDDLYSVIYQFGQYEVTWNGGLYKEEPSDIAYEVAADLLEEGSILPEGVVYQAEFEQGSDTFKIIGNTYFCYQ
jgi:hypothetical protein